MPQRAKMKKAFVKSTTVFWMLAGLLILALHPGCAAIENNNRPIKLPSNVQASQVQNYDKTQWASNAQGTLYGENAGDFIILQWTLNDDAAEYRTYRSRSLAGPWEQVLRTSQAAAATGGAKVDDTPDARLMDLCYKVQAIDAKGLVIGTYEPISVPKFVP
jgi:hypothetical protein